VKKKQKVQRKQHRLKSPRREQCGNLRGNVLSGNVRFQLVQRKQLEHKQVTVPSHQSEQKLTRYLMCNRTAAAAAAAAQTALRPAAGHFYALVWSIVHFQMHRNKIFQWIVSNMG
jgi:hypothetical protein